MRHARMLTKYALSGAVTFWAPSIILHAMRGSGVSREDVVVLSVCSPVACVAGFLILRVTERGRADAVLAALVHLLGIWLLGPLCMMVSASFSGGGFTQPVTWQSVLLSMLLFPFYTFIMATYDGTLIALGLATVTLPALAMAFQPRVSAN